MSGKAGTLALVLLLTACSSDKGLHCEYSAGNLDVIKQQVSKLKAGGTSAAEVSDTLGKPSNITPIPEGGKMYEYNFPQKLSSDSSPACPIKTQKVTFVFDGREILQSMQINF